ncbi:MAG: hypothetical protein IJO72_02540 [Oscillospiraceae bacterium]|nr:hypothetical protein [Oscillospiraceae bacterium]MBQ9929641.1 hypothetical protein [Oscillospiraceae bacterium]
MRTRKIIGMLLVLALWLGLAGWAWLRPETEFSATERRELAKLPELSWETFLDGSFVSKFESYTLDQFPLRNGFRSLKALTQYKLLNQLDNNGIYIVDGSAAALDYPLNEDSVEHALKVFGKINDRYLSGSKVYAAVVPDKGYYLARSENYPVMDYDKLFEMVEQGMPYADYVNLTDLLMTEDYYRTDTHWRQEKLLPVANRICDVMSTAKPEGLTPVKQTQPFYGVYYGQAALPMEADALFTMQGSWLDGCTVTNYENGKTTGIYDWEKLSGEDSYETFLSGSVSLLRIDNPGAETDRELIVFRDSFGSSLVPLLTRGYRTVTVVDIRYLSSAMLDRFIDFHGQDVLFLYSTLVLNSSSQLQ